MNSTIIPGGGGGCVDVLFNAKPYFTIMDYTTTLFHGLHKINTLLKFHILLRGLFTKVLVFTLRIWPAGAGLLDIGWLA